MAGGKETPRQKMIGMMYLVLTALLALNVSKQIVAAFITINDKLDYSASHIDRKINETYIEFDQKGATLRATKSNLEKFNLWQGKAIELKKSTAKVIGYLLGECNEMIKIAEGVDWVEEKDETGNIVKLKSLDKIENMDNYDVPTSLFVGGNPSSPIGKGNAIVEQIHDYRNLIAESMATYTEKEKSWSFKSPTTIAGLTEALKSANPKDTSSIAQFYKSLTIPEFLHSHGEDTELPWVSVMFDHAPIVAAAAIFTSLKLDIKTAHSFAGDYMLSKIEVEPFIFNKIDPLAFANSSYINMGDSLVLNVMVAAYDSNEVTKIRYGIDADTANRAAWKESSGQFALDGSKAGLHKVKGEIGVIENGQQGWRPWSFDYTVGQPMGVIAQPDMRILYWGYENKIEGTASGFSPDKVSLSANGCRLTSNGNGKFIAHVDRGTRNATITVSGRRDDGSSVNLGSFSYVCKPLPPAMLYFGSTENGQTCQYTAARNQTLVRVGIDPSSPLTNVRYEILSGELTVSNVPGVGSIGSGGAIEESSKRLLNQSRGQTVTIQVEYRDQAGSKKSGFMKFKVQ